MLHSLLIAALLVAQPPRIKTPAPAAGRLLDPSSSVTWAARDAQGPDAAYWRYLSLYNVAAGDRLKYVQTLGFLLNSLSRSNTMYMPFVVPDTDNSLLRIDIRNYRFEDADGKEHGWSEKAWDDLAKGDPYFAAKLVTTEQAYDVVSEEQWVPTGRYSGGQPILRQEIVQKKVQRQAKQAVISALAPWLEPQAAAALTIATGTAYPIVRGDLFIARASLSPHYEAFLELGNDVDSFLKVLQVDEALIRKVKLGMRGVVVKSGIGLEGKVIPVSDRNRSLERNPTFFGYLWRTKDVKETLDVNDYLRILNDDAFDASEWIATGRNGLQLYFLSNNQGKTQAEAPIEIVRDNTNVDRRVRNGRSCITCHLRGINEFKAMPQELVKHSIDIVSPDFRKAKFLRETYVNDIDKYVEADQAIYEKAVVAATTVKIGDEAQSLKADENANQFGSLYNRYAEAVVTLDVAAFECGVPAKDLAPIFRRAANDPYLLGLSKNLPLFAVPRAYWERSFPQAMQLVSENRK